VTIAVVIQQEEINLARLLGHTTTVRHSKIVTRRLLAVKIFV